MSRYTTQVRWIVEQTMVDNGVTATEDNWHYAYKILGLDDYPIFDETYRETINNKIIRHYYTREICGETVGRWRMFMRDTMHLIMPYYNQLYESEIIAKGIEPLKDTVMQRTEHAWGTAENDGTTSSQGTTTTDNTNVYQDTPQNEMIPTDIKQLKYATNVTIDDGTETSNVSGQSQSSGKYDNMVQNDESGSKVSQSELLKQYRETFLNIDMQVVYDQELQDCFMTVW